MTNCFFLFRPLSDLVNQFVQHMSVLLIFDRSIMSDIGRNWIITVRKSHNSFVARRMRLSTVV